MTESYKQTRERLGELLRQWNRVGLSPERLDYLASAVANAAVMAANEYSRPGRAAQFVRREAARAAKLDDAALLAYARYEAGPPSDIYVDVMREAQEAAWRLGFETMPLSVDWLRPAIRAVAEGASAGAPNEAQSAHARAIGAEIEPSGHRRGPGEEAGLAALMFDLAGVFYELTGKPPQSSNDGAAPEGTFRGFVREIDKLIPHSVGSVHRLREVCKRWKRERIRL